MVTKLRLAQIVLPTMFILFMISFATPVLSLQFYNYTGYLEGSSYNGDIFASDGVIVRSSGDNIYANAFSTDFGSTWFEEVNTSFYGFSFPSRSYVENMSENRTMAVVRNGFRLSYISGFSSSNGITDETSYEFSFEEIDVASVNDEIYMVARVFESDDVVTFRNGTDAAWQSFQFPNLVGPVAVAMSSEETYFGVADLFGNVSIIDAVTKDFIFKYDTNASNEISGLYVKNSTFIVAITSGNSFAGEIITIIDGTVSKKNYSSNNAFLDVECLDDLSICAFTVADGLGNYALYTTADITSGASSMTLTEETGVPKARYVSIDDATGDIWVTDGSNEIYSIRVPVEGPPLPVVLPDFVDSIFSFDSRHLETPELTVTDNFLIKWLGTDLNFSGANFSVALDVNLGEASSFEVAETHGKSLSTNFGTVSSEWGMVVQFDSPQTIIGFNITATSPTSCTIEDSSGDLGTTSNITGSGTDYYADFGAGVEVPASENVYVYCLIGDLYGTDAFLTPTDSGEITWVAGWDETMTLDNFYLVIDAITYSGTSYDLAGQDRWVSVDSGSLPSDVNTTANLTFYSANDYVNPVIYRDGVECTECSLLENTGTELIYEVPGFSNYSVENSSSPETSQIMLYSVDQMDSGVSGFELYGGLEPFYASTETNFLYLNYTGGNATNSSYDVNFTSGEYVNITGFAMNSSGLGQDEVYFNAYSIVKRNMVYDADWSRADGVPGNHTALPPYPDTIPLSDPVVLFFNLSGMTNTERNNIEIAWTNFSTPFPANPPINSFRYDFTTTGVTIYQANGTVWYSGALEDYIWTIFDGDQVELWSSTSYKGTRSVAHSGEASLPKNVGKVLDRSDNGGTITYRLGLARNITKVVRTSALPVMTLVNFSASNGGQIDLFCVSWTDVVSIIDSTTEDRLECTVNGSLSAEVTYDGNYPDVEFWANSTEKYSIDRMVSKNVSNYSSVDFVFLSPFSQLTAYLYDEYNDVQLSNFCVENGNGTYFCDSDTDVQFTDVAENITVVDDLNALTFTLTSSVTSDVYGGFSYKPRSVQQLRSITGYNYGSRLPQVLKIYNETSGLLLVTFTGLRGNTAQQNLFEPRFTLYPDTEYEFAISVNQSVSANLGRNNTLFAVVELPFGNITDRVDDIIGGGFTDATFQLNNLTFAELETTATYTFNASGYFDGSDEVKIYGSEIAEANGTTKPLPRVYALAVKDELGNSQPFWNETDTNINVTWSDNALGNTTTNSSEFTVQDQQYGLATTNSFSVGENIYTVTLTETYNDQSASASNTTDAFNVSKLQPVTNVQPDGVTITNNPYWRINWTAATEGIGTYAYEVKVDLNGTNTTVVSSQTVTNYTIDNWFVETTQGKVYVTASDDYFTADAGTNAVDFIINIIPTFVENTCQALTYPNENDQPEAVRIPVNFTVNYGGGITQDTINEVSVSLGANTYSTTTCSVTTTSSTEHAYNCSIPMSYYYVPGDYDLFINVTVAPGKTATTTVNNVCEYAELLASQRTVDSVTFPTAGPGINNAQGTPAVTILNTGNVELNFSMRAYDLEGRTDSSEALLASNFKAGNDLTNATLLADGILKDLNYGLFPGNGASNSITLWLSMPISNSNQEYYTPTAWQVVTSG